MDAKSTHLDTGKELTKAHKVWALSNLVQDIEKVIFMSLVSRHTF